MEKQTGVELHPSLWHVDEMVCKIKQWAKASTVLNEQVEENKALLASATSISIGYCCNRRLIQKDFETLIERLVEFSFLIIEKNGVQDQTEKNILTTVAEIITALLETNAMMHTKNLSGI